MRHRGQVVVGRRQGHELKAGVWLGTVLVRTGRAAKMMRAQGKPRRALGEKERERRERRWMGMVRSRTAACSGGVSGCGGVRAACGWGGGASRWICSRRERRRVVILMVTFGGWIWWW